jgi:hypothetical protein
MYIIKQINNYIKNNVKSIFLMHLKKKSVMSALNRIFYCFLQHLNSFLNYML